VKRAQEFIDNYYTRYWGLKAFQDSVAEEVEASKFKTGKHTSTGYPIHGGIYRSITGRSYYFEEQDAPEWMREKGTYTSFSPTKFKNYPIQGFATGDVVPEMLGRVNRYLYSWKRTDNPLLINTVHDSMLLDVPPNDNITSIMRHVVVDLQAILEDVPKALEERWGITTDLPFNVGFEVGDSWGTTKKYSI